MTEEVKEEKKEEVKEERKEAQILGVSLGQYVVVKNNKVWQFLFAHDATLVENLEIIRDLEARLVSVKESLKEKLDESTESVKETEDEKEYTATVE